MGTTCIDQIGVLHIPHYYYCMMLLPWPTHYSAIRTAHSRHFQRRDHKISAKVWYLLGNRHKMHTIEAPLRVRPDLDCSFHQKMMNAFERVCQFLLHFLLRHHGAYSGEGVENVGELGLDPGDAAAHIGDVGE
jgi:hypothetical protein